MASRAERRRTTERRILAAAQSLFTERGFERTTIRAVAAAAHVDPALVMQYFGSKQALFGAAVRGSVDSLADAQPDELVERMLTTLGVKVGGLPQASLAMLRSMLTHPQAAAEARAVLDAQIEQIGAAIPAPDARLRAALIMATMLGVTIGRELLDVGALADATPQEVAELLRPSFEALVATSRAPAI
jgi:AcrR family transcriptional regulator